MSQTQRKLLLVYQPRVPGFEVSRARLSEFTSLAKRDFDRQGATKVA